MFAKKCGKLQERRCQEESEKRPSDVLVNESKNDIMRITNREKDCLSQNKIMGKKVRMDGTRRS